MVIVNGNSIYRLEKAHPVMVALESSVVQVIVTDGFHYTTPLLIHSNDQLIQQVSVSCAIDDDQLVIGLILLILFYAAGLSSGISTLKILRTSCSR